ncbi:hypothetical protein HOF67_04415 [Candidatus Peregrinibacteria bacterium]|jgi:uncharacterized repeat protein (TIGR01451 family)|nr:hypothetical protein [Candidatus Peregrinibacteria bacterium]
MPLVSLKKLLVSVVAFVIPFVQIFAFIPFAAADTAYAASGETKEVFDVVALVIHKDLLDDGSTYSGIIDAEYMNQLAGYDSLPDRIERYARDIQIHSPGTVVERIEYNPGKDTLLDVVNALENLYKNGVEREESRLRGVVLIGQVPLPVVNKNGNRFVSMFPMTDFDEKGYVFNPGTESFERVDEVSSPQPEIWHGILREPSLNDNPEVTDFERNKLAYFFDKNHLYYEGESEYADFAKKMFVGDLVHEEEGINEDVFASYMRSVRDAEDLAYFRYNKHWATELYMEVMGGFQEDGVFDVAVTEDNAEYLETLNEVASGEADQFKDMKDILLKPVIDKYYSSYVAATTRFISVVNDLAINTGRYDPEKSQVVSIPALIAVKDIFASKYLRAANDALELKMNEIIEEIAEPVPLIDYTEISVENGNFQADGVFRNHFEEDDKMYVNGVSSDFLNSPKQCYPYLGSSDENGVLARSITTDSILTGMTRYGLAVNGYGLSAGKALELSDGAVSHGMVIDDRPDYGIPAFFNESPLEQSGLEKGDIIVSVRPTYRFILDENGKMVEGLCKDDEFNTSSTDPKTLIYSQMDLDNAVDKAWQKVAADGKHGGTDENHSYCSHSYVTVEYYDASAKDVVELDVSFDFDVTPHMTRIYSLSKKHDVYGDNDLEGCFFSSTALNDDRCFSRIATYPVVDPSGSYEPYYSSGVLVENEEGLVPGDGSAVVDVKLENDTNIWMPLPGEYPEEDLLYYPDVRREDFSNLGIDEEDVLYEHQFPVGYHAIYEQKGDELRHYWHNELFQLPKGRTFEEVDEIYLDGCFNFLPDYNVPIRYNGLTIGKSLFDLLIGQYAGYGGGNGGNKNHHTPYGGNGTNVPILDSTENFSLPGLFDETTWDYLMERYGLFDGIDNDGDGIVDYENLDEDGDGVFETFKFDVEESEAKYGLEKDNVYMLGRYFLSRNYNWEAPAVFDVPEGEYWYPFVGEDQSWSEPFNFDTNATLLNFSTSGVLKIKPNVRSEFSSLILHNEPTNYTISRQWQSKIAHSLPIDDPRYVAFMDVNGNVQRVDYLNLFAAESYFDFVADVQHKAEDISLLPGASEEIEAEVRDSLLRVSTGLVEEEGTDEYLEENYIEKDYVKVLTKANPDILKDSLDWAGKSIDDKHEYILKYYLNAKEQGYVADSPYGYETAYLVLDGSSFEDSDYYDTSFNKKPLKEVDPHFNPYSAAAVEEYSLKIDDEGYPIKEKDENGIDLPTLDDALEYVGLKQFFKELKRFIGELEGLVENFDTNVSMEMACEYNGTFEVADDEKELPGLTKLELVASKDLVLSGEDDYVDLSVTGYGADGVIYDGGVSPTLEISIGQDLAHPIFEISPADELKILSGGHAKYRLRTTDYSGKASMSVKAIFPKGGGEDKTSNNLQISTTENSIDVLLGKTELAAGSEEVSLITMQLLRDGELDTAASYDVSLEFMGEQYNAKAENGIAEVEVTPGTEAGIYEVKAFVSSDNSFAPGYDDIFVTPGEVSRIEILSDTNVLESNNQATANLTFKLFDKYNNLVSHTFEKIAVFAFGEAVLDITKDTDALVPGVQMPVQDGVAHIEVQAKDMAEDPTIYVVLLDNEIEDMLAQSAVGEIESLDFGTAVKATKKLTMYEETRVQVYVSESELLVGGEESAQITATLTDTSGQVLSGYNGPVAFTNTGGAPEAMSSGSATTYIKSGIKAGKVTVEVSVPGFSSNSVEIYMKPDEPVLIDLASDTDVIYTSSVDDTVLVANLLDQYGNLSDASVPIAFTLSSGTEEAGVVEILEADPYAVNGVGKATVESTGRSGVANFVAEAAGLEPGYLTMDIKKRVSNISYDSFAPKALYMNVFGGPFFDLGRNDLAASLLYNGQSQAILTTTSDTEDRKKVLFMDGFGNVDILDPNVDSYIVKEDGLMKLAFYDRVFEEELGNAFVVLDDNLGLAVVDEFDEFTEGVLVKKIGEDFKDLKFEMSGDGVKAYLRNGAKTLLRIDSKGVTEVSDNDIDLRAPVAGEEGVEIGGFSFVVMWKGATVGQILYKQKPEGDVRLLSSSQAVEILLPGTYMQLAANARHFAMKPGFSKYSTEFAKGAYIVDLDKDIASSMAPGFGSISAEDAKESEGVGLAFDNKNLLYFTAGNSVGDSNIPYASEVGVLLGDPNIRLWNHKNPVFTPEHGYAKTIGQPLLNDDAVIKNIEPFDYNGDGYDDLLLMYEDGTVKLLENEISNQKFRDRGVLLSLANGIMSMSKVDIDDDGFDDLIIGTEDSCIKGDPCLYLYKNNNGSFERELLKFNNFDTSDRIYEMKSADLNGDGLAELTLTDSTGNLYVYWNVDGDFDPEGDILGNFGMKLDGLDLSGDLAIRYPGMSGSDVVLTIPTEHGETGVPAEGEDYSPKPYNFVGTVLDDVFVESSKSANNLNGGGAISLGDVVDYTITLKNGSSASIYNVMLSDVTPPSQTIMEDTLDCLDSLCPDVLNGTLKWKESYSPLRSRVISGISVPANGIRTLSYKAVIGQTPKVSFEVGDFEIGESGHDEYKDFLVRPDVSLDNTITYFDSSNYLDPGGRVQYIRREVDASSSNGVSDEAAALADSMAGVEDLLPPEVPNLNELLGGEEDGEECTEEQEEAGLCDGVLVNVNNQPPAGLEDTIAQLDKDSNGDGLPDFFGGGSGGAGDGKESANGDEDEDEDEDDFDWDFPDSMSELSDMAGAASEMADAALDKVEGLVDQLTCEGGSCLPSPYNHAFFAPSETVPGTALVAVMTPVFPFFSFFYPVPPKGSANSSFRLYLSPTLNLGLGLGVCWGPSVTAGWCVPAAIPVDKLMNGMCESVMEAIEAVIKTATDYVQSGVNNMTTAISNGSNTANNPEENSTTTFGGASNPLSLQVTHNIKIPGFPAVFTDWMDAQIEEVYNKLLDLPNFYIIFPDVPSLVSDTVTSLGDFADIKNPFDFLTLMNQIPLIQIKGEEVLLKVPVINENEIIKWSRQATLLVKNLEDQWEETKKYWGCDEYSERKTVCDSVTLKTTVFIKNVEQVLAALEKYKDLPKQIIQLKSIKQKYARQLICYLDTVMDVTGGYVKRQGKTVASWIKMINDIIMQFETWSTLFDLAIDYNESCDECKSDRFTEISTILQLFGGLPTPSVIPFPKWPDFVLDLSKLQLGTQIIWPDIVLKPQPIVLPNLPSITFPKIFPEVVLDLDGLIPDFSLDLPPMPNLVLPDLPPLPIPKLPDLPKPPKIPALPRPAMKIATTLKKIFRVLCLIKKGFMPIPESALKHEIEVLTEPNNKITIPFLMDLGFSAPSIEYEAPVEFRFTLHSKFGVSTDAIYQAVKETTDGINEYVEKYVGEINNYTRSLKVPYIENLDRTLQEKLGIPPKIEIDGAKVKEELQSSSGYLYAFESEYLDPDSPILNKDIGDLDYVDLDGYDAGYSRQLAEFRNSLLGYARGLDDVDSLENFVALENSFGSRDVGVLASASSSLPGSSSGRLAVSSFPMLDIEAPLAEEARTLLAAGLEDFDVGDYEVATPTPAGMHVFTADGLKENILYYTDDLSKETHIVYLDADLDGDDDIIYSTGGDLYLKQNYLGDNEELDTVNSLSGVSALDKYSKDGIFSIQGYELRENNHNASTVKFTPASSEGVVGYEVFVVPSLIEMDSNTYEKGYRYVLFEDPEDVVGTVVDLDGGLLFSTHTIDGEPLDEDMTVVQDNVVSAASSGQIELEFSNGAETIIKANEEFQILKLTNANNPSVDVNLIDGNYYSVVYALDANGMRSYISTQTPISPQICGDDDAPLPALSNTELYVPVTKTLVIDASASFDPSGEISEYYIDSNIGKDTDGDGNPANDKDPELWRYFDDGSGVSTSKFELGPFEEVADYQVALNVVDLAKNISSQVVDIHVYVPNIIIEPVLMSNPVVTGLTEIPSGDMPFALMRERYRYRVVDEELVMIPNKSKIATGAANEYGQYTTFSDGTYKIGDFNLSNMILILNSAGEVIGEVNEDTGNFWLVDGYTYIVHTAQPPLHGTYVEIADPTGASMGYLYFVADGSVSVKIFEGLEFDSENTGSLVGVNVSDVNLSDQFEFRQYPPNDPNYPNGAYLHYLAEDKQMVAIDTFGNILIIDDRITIKKKVNYHSTDPFVFELYFGDKKVGEVYVSTTGLFNEAQIVGPKDVPYNFPNSITPQYLYKEQALDPITGNGGSGGPLNPSEPVFTDLTGRLYEYAMSLYHQGLISADSNFNPGKLLTRSEFVVMLINILCIVPRPSAYDKPEVFSDVPHTDPLSYYYPYLKEGALLGLITGYEDDNPNTLNPFEPNETINLAEAVKILVEGLELQGIIDLSDVDFEMPGPWYRPYLGIAMNLPTFAKEGIDLKSSYIITEEEALEPGKELTRGELLELAYRVLEAYNCLEIDRDEDGMSDYCENKYGIDDPNADPDEDGLINSDECYYGTDPNDYDTDDGGVGDGDEVKYGTNPLYGEDDLYDTDGDGLLDVEEIQIYHTDPHDPDTDDGGVYDGAEVQNQTDPLDGSDDYIVGEGGAAGSDGQGGTGQILESEPGIYVVPATCSTCPCISTFDYKADLRKGDVLYTIIVNQDETKVYTKSNETKVN